MNNTISAYNNYLNQGINYSDLKKNEKEIETWPFDQDGFLLVPGYIDGKYSNSTNLLAEKDYSTPQITLSRYVDIR